MNIIRLVLTFFGVLVASFFILFMLFSSLQSNDVGAIVLCTCIIIATMITIKVWEYSRKQNNKDQ